MKFERKVCFYHFPDICGTKPELHGCRLDGKGEEEEAEEKNLEGKRQENFFFGGGWGGVKKIRTKQGLL